MKKSIKYFGVSAMLLLSATLIQAQHPQHRMNKQGYDNLKSELNLSEAQQAELKKLQKENQIKREMIRKDEKISIEEKRASMRQIREEQKQAMENILSEEQKGKLELLKKERQVERQEKFQQRKEMHQQEISKMKQLRKEFDQKISAEDRDKIEAYKAKRSLHREEMNLIDKENVELRKQKMQQFRSENEKERAEIKQLGEKYKDEMKAFMTEKGIERKNHQQRTMKKRGARNQYKKIDKEEIEFKSQMEKREKIKKHRKEHAPERFLMMDFE